MKAIEPDIRAFGVESLSIFGSVARDEAEARSDLDVFVDPGTDAFYGLRNYVGAYRRLVEAFPGVTIGYSTRQGLASAVRPTVEREAVRVF
ncbi:nucleotidyltransferase domain-containing protein [Methylobacterium sp. Leaf108]|uniref:nucleotidyltransferase family protein n=1 Tax=Methylobacterium sp. Leaf108 TaxID=1736256 RepID=UPI0019107BA6|nr:nucleotidyltransferase domain-containing protein [Methylobacterium sp. Leaf108]